MSIAKERDLNGLSLAMISMINNHQSIKVMSNLGHKVQSFT